MTTVVVALAMAVAVAVAVSAEAAAAVAVTVPPMRAGGWLVLGRILDLLSAPLSSLPPPIQAPFAVMVVIEFTQELHCSTMALAIGIKSVLCVYCSPTPANLKDYDTTQTVV